MICTEEEAIGIKWCPFTRLAPYDRNALSPPFNRVTEVGGVVYHNPPDCRCLGSECMAWIWVTPADTPLPQQLPASPQEYRKGCCGLAHTRAGVM
jgi:hypothetical protein